MLILRALLWELSYAMVYDTHVTTLYNCAEKALWRKDESKGHTAFTASYRQDAVNQPQTRGHLLTYPESDSNSAHLAEVRDGECL